MKLSRKATVLASASLLLMVFVVQSATLGTSVLAQSTVGVNAGDWVKYYVMAAFMSDDPNMQIPAELLQLNETEWVKNVVTDVTGTKLTFERVFHYKNGTETKTVEHVDFNTGESSPDGLFMFVPTNLGKDDFVYPSMLESYWINETVRRTYMGIPRDVNHLNVSSTVVSGSQVTLLNANYYWDKITGILCDRPGSVVTFDGNYTTRFAISEMIIDTNLWVGDTESPVADAGQDLTVTEDESVLFDGSNCDDNVGIVVYEWHVGDGNSDEGPMVIHTYTDPGSYIVTLTVWDAAGNTATDTITVDVEEAESSSSTVVVAAIILVLIVGALVWIWKKT